MIYYRFDPEMDHDLLKSINDVWRLPDSISTYLTGEDMEMKHNEEAYVFAEDDERAGLIWLTIVERASMDITCLYIIKEGRYTEKFQMKMMDFAIKRAKYLGLSKISFQNVWGRDGLSQLNEELGCSRIHGGSTDNIVECFLK